MIIEPGIRTGKRTTTPVFPDLKRLASVFGKYPNVQAVYIFGSAATGKVHAESDLDLALVPQSDAEPLPKLDILTDLAGAGFCNVDLVILDTDDIVLKHEAVRQNTLVYQAEDFDRGAYYSRTVRQFLDFKPYLAAQRQVYKMRIVHAQA